MWRVATCASSPAPTPLRTHAQVRNDEGRLAGRSLVDEGLAQRLREFYAPFNQDLAWLTGNERFNLWGKQWAGSGRHQGQGGREESSGGTA